MAEMRVSFSSGMFAVLDDEGKTIQFDYANEDTLANIANIGADYGKVIDTTEDDGKLLAIRIEIPERRLKRLTKETQILAMKRAWLGHVGYVLGLHSGVYVNIDPKTKEPQKVDYGEDSDYAGVVQALHVRKGYYMWVTVGKSAHDKLTEPKFFEDYIFLRQMERAGKKVELPERIPEAVFEELLDSLTKLISAPSFLLTPRGKVMLARRYAGIAVGLMVRWGFKEDIPTLMAVATNMSLDNRVDGRIYQSLVDAVKLAQKWGDI